MFKIRTLKTPIIPPTNIIRSIFVNEMFLNAGNRVKNKRAFSNPITVTGEVEFLNHHEVTNDVYALKNTVCFRISVAQYEDILLHDLIFMRYLARTLSNRLYHANHNTAISINYPVENRLASYLISSAQQLIIKDNFVQVAEMIGCSYRQLQRVLNDFCQCGYLCKVKRGNYLITDESALKALGQDLYYI